MTTPAVSIDTNKARHAVKTGVDWFLNLSESIGHSIMGFFQSVGVLVMFAGRALMHCFVPPFYPRLILRICSTGMSR